MANWQFEKMSHKLHLPIILRHLSQVVFVNRTPVEMILDNSEILYMSMSFHFHANIFGCSRICRN